MGIVPAFQVHVTYELMISELFGFQQMQLRDNHVR